MRPSHLRKVLQESLRKLIAWLRAAVMVINDPYSMPVLDRSSSDTKEQKNPPSVCVCVLSSPSLSLSLSFQWSLGISDDGQLDIHSMIEEEAPCSAAVRTRWCKMQGHRKLDFSSIIDLRKLEQWGLFRSHCRCRLRTLVIPPQPNLISLHTSGYQTPAAGGRTGFLGREGKYLKKSQIGKNTFPARGYHVKTWMKICEFRSPTHVCAWRYVVALPFFPSVTDWWATKSLPPVATTTCVCCGINDEILSLSPWKGIMDGDGERCQDEGERERERRRWIGFAMSKEEDNLDARPGGVIIETAIGLLIDGPAKRPVNAHISSCIAMMQNYNSNTYNTITLRVWLSIPGIVPFSYSRNSH